MTKNILNLVKKIRLLFIGGMSKFIERDQAEKNQPRPNIQSAETFEELMES